MDMSMFWCDGEGFSAGADVDDGICIPGMFICSGEAFGLAVCVCSGIPCMPGMFISIVLAGDVFGREEAREREGMFMPFILIALVPPLFCVRFLLAAVDLDFGLLLGLLLPMFMPGMFCMSCCAQTGAAATRSRQAAMAMQTVARRIDLKPFIDSPPE
jgi:hypothetical protein